MIAERKQNEEIRWENFTVTTDLPDATIDY
jgi:hypothetical protein